MVRVTPRTVIAWHQAGFRRYWKWLSPTQRTGGRQPTRSILRRSSSLERKTTLSQINLTTRGTDLPAPWACPPGRKKPAGIRAYSRPRCSRGIWATSADWSAPVCASILDGPDRTRKSRMTGRTSAAASSRRHLSHRATCPPPAPTKSAVSALPSSTPKKFRKRVSSRTDIPCRDPEWPRRWGMPSRFQHRGLATGRPCEGLDFRFSIWPPASRRGALLGPVKVSALRQERAGTALISYRASTSFSGSRSSFRTPAGARQDFFPAVQLFGWTLFPGDREPAPNADG